MFNKLFPELQNSLFFIGACRVHHASGEQKEFTSDRNVISSHRVSVFFWPFSFPVQGSHLCSPCSFVFFSWALCTHGENPLGIISQAAGLHSRDRCAAQWGCYKHHVLRWIISFPFCLWESFMRVKKTDIVIRFESLVIKKRKIILRIRRKKEEEDIFPTLPSCTGCLLHSNCREKNWNWKSRK